MDRIASQQIRIRAVFQVPKPVVPLLVVFPDEKPPPVKHRYLRICAKTVHGSVEIRPFYAVIGVERHYQVGRRVCYREISGIRDAVVLITEHLKSVVILDKALNNLFRIVGGSVVNYYAFEILQRLIFNRLNAVFYILRLIVVWNYNRYLRITHFNYIILKLLPALALYKISPDYVVRASILTLTHRLKRRQTVF